MSEQNRAVIEKLYAAFNARDAEGMIACYHPDAKFSDPVFGELGHAAIAGMWRMLCERAKDLQITVSNVRADENSGGAHWDAEYTFGKTGRKVRNSIDSRFSFLDGRIVEQRDHFSLWRWARMALGPTGVLLGWASPLQGAIRRGAQGDLEKYLKRRAEPQASPP